MERSDFLPVAFVGLGRIASLLEDDPLREKPASHAGAIADNPRTTIAAGYDRDGERRDLFARRWGAPVFTSFPEMIEAVRPKIVVIATHPDSHFFYLKEAARAGIPVAICEKPIADTITSARRMVQLERHDAIRVVVNHERRFSRDYRLVRDAIRDNRFGGLLSIHARLYFGSQGRHDRVFLHDGTHIVDAIHFLTTDTIELRRRVGYYRSSRSSVYLHGTLARRDIPVLIDVGAQRRYLLFEVELSFEDGEITLGNGVFRWSRGAESPYYSTYRSLCDLGRTVPQPSGYFSGMVAEAVRLAEDPVARSESSLEDGLAAMKVIDRAARNSWGRWW